MTEWTLIFVLITGEARAQPVDEGFCRMVADRVESGEGLSVELTDGSTVGVRWVVCLPPCECEQEAGS